MQLSNYYMFLALETARQRVAEADAQRLAALGRPGEQRPSVVRRTIARVAFAVARAADGDVGRAPLRTH